jgi:hypothetical protein
MNVGFFFVELTYLGYEDLKSDLSLVNKSVIEPNCRRLISVSLSDGVDMTDFLKRETVRVTIG